MDMRWLRYGQVKGVTGGVTIIRELPGVKGVTGDLNIITLTLVPSQMCMIHEGENMTTCEHSESTGTEKPCKSSECCITI